eukprot:TRINITY_DN3155_c1_g5_i1.p2 TRINITY_DN3155_c1_g5~~TRINITY_DN3155_c1_g5_i1.p2  ORF type:complete len:244 (-),score=52.54 TRINITY_DN3155_c1_g5_i1:2139-2870(-)
MIQDNNIIDIISGKPLDSQPVRTGKRVQPRESRNFLFDGDTPRYIRGKKHIIPKDSDEYHYKTRTKPKPEFDSSRAGMSSERLTHFSDAKYLHRRRVKNFDAKEEIKPSRRKPLQPASYEDRNVIDIANDTVKYRSLSRIVEKPKPSPSKERYRMNRAPPSTVLDYVTSNVEPLSIKTKELPEFRTSDVFRLDKVEPKLYKFEYPKPKQAVSLNSVRDTHEYAKLIKQKMTSTSVDDLLLLNK